MGKRSVAAGVAFAALLWAGPAAAKGVDPQRGVEAAKAAAEREASGLGGKAAQGARSLGRAYGAALAWALDASEPGGPREALRLSRWMEAAESCWLTNAPGWNGSDAQRMAAMEKAQAGKERVVQAAADALWPGKRGQKALGQTDLLFAKVEAQSQIEAHRVGAEPIEDAKACAIAAGEGR